MRISRNYKHALKRYFHIILGAVKPRLIHIFVSYGYRFSPEVPLIYATDIAGTFLYISIKVDIK